ncbi:MAG: L-serine ammonia-lyase, iron-sulfur-dependent, subunit alpha, partial [Alphaproteobacteria bacterium]|nr:L-serine ammonia-lyase, iron-sulfur-dependent, subunit alpha [Alphaproteobacteria bacterium]
MFLSIFDVFKIGIGPSSSHTMGPMTAARRFLAELASSTLPRAARARPAALTASLHGSLAFTGIGHGSGRAVILGLCGQDPRTVDPDAMDAMVAAVGAQGQVHPPGHPAYRFRPALDLVFDKTNPLPGHPNGLQFAAYDEDGQLLLRRAYFSVGGGFVVSAEELESLKHPAAPADDVPYPFTNAADMLAMARTAGLSIAGLKRANEQVRLSRTALDRGIEEIWSVMSGCIDRGIAQDGILPGGLKVKRRAAAIHRQLDDQWQRNELTPLMANDWLSLYAMAVNEENAGGGRVVTA